jgi:hypothetical protein
MVQMFSVEFSFVITFLKTESISQYRREFGHNYPAGR